MLVAYFALLSIIIGTVNGVLTCQRMFDKTERPSASMLLVGSLALVTIGVVSTLSVISHGSVEGGAAVVVIVSMGIGVLAFGASLARSISTDRRGNRMDTVV